MSVSAVSYSSSVSQTSGQSSTNQLQQLFKQLANSLESGNLPGAQKAYAGLQKLLQTSQSSSQTSSGQPASPQDSLIQSDLAAVGQALNSGDLSGAQSDFSKLQSDLKSASQSGQSGSAQALGSARRGHHHRRVSTTAGSDSTEAATQTPSASTNGTQSSSSTGSTISIYA